MANTGVKQKKKKKKKKIEVQKRKINSSNVLVFSISKPLAVHQACPEALCEGLDPVVSQHHSLRQAEVELLLLAQNHTVGPCY